ncbi:MAG: polysaccharide biosynthesis protein [Ruminococcaceae bacterium]|nr:polysaccharide biosynthesis protein [Oscillospiraceae bacterium]
MKKSKKYIVRQTLLIATDLIALSFVAFWSLWIRFEFDLSKMIITGYFFNLLKMLPVTIILSLIVFKFAGLYSSLWEYAGEQEVVRTIISCFVSSFMWIIIQLITGLRLPRSFVFIYFVFSMLCIFMVRLSYRILRRVKENRRSKDIKVIRTMVIGAGSAGALVVKELQQSSHSRNKVVCVLDDDKFKIGKLIHGVSVVGNTSQIEENVEKYKIDEIVLAMPSVSNKIRSEILNACKNTSCTLKTLPGIYQLMNGEVNIQKIRNVEIEDLLSRESIKVNVDEIIGYVKGKVVLVTGGGGSIGSELCRQIASHQPKELIIFDIYENSAYAIQQELKRTHPELNLTVLIGSVRDKERVNNIFAEYKPNLVYHAAAHKHVPLMENSPKESIKNNVFGTLNVAEAAHTYEAESFILISTDKAVNPTNIMGASKRICEMIVCRYAEVSDTKFACVRFGNVLGSNGSVIPLFKKQIAAGGPVTVTHRDIIRYFMTIPEAVSLVLQAGSYAKKGEIFVLDMGEPVRIDDLARNMIKLSGFEPDVDIKVEYTGLRPGEKLYEELLMSEEGLGKTENNLIYIGKLEHIDKDVFEKKLGLLKDAISDNTADIRACVKALVPTYRIKPEEQGDTTEDNNEACAV